MSKWHNVQTEAVLQNKAICIFFKHLEVIEGHFQNEGHFT